MIIFTQRNINCYLGGFVFITIEGIEGVGKSTLIGNLKNYFEASGQEVVLTREPGGTILSEKIRSILKDADLTGAICPTAELFLFYASRFQNVSENIVPALKRSCVTINDRYIDSSVSYQGSARGLDMQLIQDLNTKYGLPVPDITLWLDAPVEIGMARALNRSKADRFEQEKHSFFEKVRFGFAEIHRNDPDRFKRIDATLSQDQVFAEAVRLLDAYSKV